MIAQAGDTHKPIGKLPAKKTPPWLPCANRRVHVQTVCQDTHTSKKNHPPDRPFLRDLYSRVPFFLYLIFFVVQISREKIVFFPSQKKKLIESFLGGDDDDDVLTLFGVIGLISLFLFLNF